MRELFGIFLLFWGGLSGYFAYGAALIAGHYRVLGWSYVDVPLRRAFGEETKSVEEVDQMWALAIANTRAFDPSVTDSRFGLAKFIADGFVDSTSLNFSRGSWFLTANSVVSVVAGVLLVRSPQRAKGAVSSAE
ncbi:MAG: hypothetical protein U0573_10200 [Phycisphaerales bacterium]|nr:hypothetical protein [Planctomycetota bacterium]